MAVLSVLVYTLSTFFVRAKIKQAKNREKSRQKRALSLHFKEIIALDLEWKKG